LSLLSIEPLPDGSLHGSTPRLAALIGRPLFGVGERIDMGLRGPPRPHRPRGFPEPCSPPLRLLRISRLLRGIAREAQRPTPGDITGDVAYSLRSARHITLGDVSHAIALTCL